MVLLRNTLPACLLLLLLSLSACTGLPTSTAVAPASWQQSVNERERITHWKVRGRLGVQTETEGGSLDLFWSQRGDAYTIRLVAPLGQGTLLIKGDAGGVTLRSADGVQHAVDADALLTDSLGVELPVTALRHWLRGMPLAGLPVNAQRWNNEGQLARLVQQQWQVEFSDYQPVQEVMLPHAFFLGRDDRPELEIRLLINHWQTGAS